MCKERAKRGDHCETRRSPKNTISGGSGLRAQVPGVLHKGPAETGERWLGTPPAELGHRLNNILAVIMMNLSWVEHNVHPEDEEMGAVLQETKKAARRLRDEIQEEINVRRRQMGGAGQWRE